jgi:hypothetical protein
MASVGKTQLTMVHYPNGAVSIFKGGRNDGTYSNVSEAKQRIEILKKLGFGKGMAVKVLKA